VAVVGGLRSRARRTLSRYIRRLNLGGRYRGHVDGFSGQEIYGWVVRSHDNRGGLDVGLFVADGLLATASASQFRADVRDAGIGDGHAGFAIPVTPAIRAAAARHGGVVHVRVLDKEPYELGRVALPRAGAAWLNPGGPLIDQCRKLLYGDLEEFRRLMALLDSGIDADTPPPLARHDLLFSTDRVIPVEIGPGIRRLPAYIEYVRYRARQDRAFDTEACAEDVEHFIDFYLKSYGVSREGLRAPLSRELIAHLNEPLVMGGQRYTISRYMWWRILANPPMRQIANLDDLATYDSLAFWWAWQEAKILQVEDCLVPPRVIERLRTVRAERRTEQAPMTVFMEHLHQKCPQYAFLDTGTVEGRTLFVACLLVGAVRRPDALRYLHPPTVAGLLAADDGATSPFERFLGALLRSEKPPAMPQERFARILRLAGYDMGRNSFTSITPKGDRLHAATLPAVRPGRKVDVQLIGPFRKASGLGMATRLSARILARTGLETRCVDFGMDNPAADVTAGLPALEEFGPARVNLIHLNAESMPLIFAYGPDVLSGAYNIGYFFWELDSPALVHYLGMGLLDEIWVSADYGVGIYAPEAGKPVVNVGMCHEETPEIDRAAARAALDARFGFSGNEFVVFVAFDSFSFAQRKNPLGVLAAFARAFPDVPEARLILKTQNKDFVVDPVQHRIWHRIEAMIAADPRIVLMNETLSYAEVLALKAGSDCYLSLHRSEGWGFGMIEAMNLKVPVVCTGYSGNMEFCTEATCWLVDYTEVPLDREDYIFVRRGQKWAEPDIDHAARQLRAVWADPAARRARVEAAYAHIRRNFSPEAIARRYEARLRQIFAGLDGTPLKIGRA
jgi:glycosyltransferase involved in cell wall biosynthesis